MSSQPASGDQFTVVSGGPGTTVLKDTNANLVRVSFPGTYVGTITFHDSATAAGTSGTSDIISFGLPTTSTPFHVDIGARCRYGLLYEATGTPLCTIIWD